MGENHVRDGRELWDGGVREATMRFGSDPRHVSWMAIPCPRAATGDDCPASPQGAPLTPRHTHKHARMHKHTDTHINTHIDEQYGWQNTWPQNSNCAIGHKTHAVKADHHKISAIKSGSLLINVKQIDTNTHTGSWGLLHMVSISYSCIRVSIKYGIQEVIMTQWSARLKDPVRFF